MVRVEVKPSVLEWALRRSGRAPAVEEKFPKLGDWLAGKSMPTLRQLERFAKATSTPFGFLFLSKPPLEELRIPHFRSVATMAPQRPSPELLATVHTMELRQAWMRDYLVELGQEPLPFVGSARKGEEPREVARRMRRALRLDRGWAAGVRTWSEALVQLRRRMEDVGILVMANGIVGNNVHRKLSVEEFRGFVLVDDYAPLVFVNSRDAKAAQMFTLAHELAHVWYGVSAAFDLRNLEPARDPTELACNQASAEFLVPEEELRAVWGSTLAPQGQFQAVARQFKVSELVAARRALDVGLIRRDDFLDFYRQYQERPRPQPAGEKGGNFYAMQGLRVGYRFARAVISAVRSGKMLYKEAYRLTGLYGATFERFAKSVMP